MKRLFLIIFILFLIASVSASTQINYTASKGGVFNGGFETGVGSKSSTPGWVGSENYGWYAGLTDSIVSYDTVVYHSGSKSMNLTTITTSGVAYIDQSPYPEPLPLLSKHAIPVKSSTKYKVSYWVKSTNVNTNAVRCLFLEYNATGSNIVSTYSASLPAGTNNWTNIITEFTTSSTTVYAKLMMRNYAAGNIGSAWYDDITLEEVVTDTQATAYTVKPVVQGVTSVDNIDVSKWGLSNLGALSEFNGQEFQPTKSKITGVKLPIWKIGTPISNNLVTVSIQTGNASHYPSGTVLASTSVNMTTLPSSSDVMTTFNVPCILETTQKYWVVISVPVNASTINSWYNGSGGSGDYYAYGATGWLFTGSANQRNMTVLYAKNTEDVSVDVNGVRLSLISNGTAIGDATGILSGATIDTDKGFYNWTSGTTVDIQKLTDIYSASLVTPGDALPTPSGISGWSYKANSGILQLTSASSTKAENITYKVNTMLPVGSVTITSKLYSGNTSVPKVWVSNDNTTWVTISHHPSGVGYSTNITTTNVLSGNTTFYVKWGKESGSDYTLGNIMWINATLNTTGLPTQSVIAGTNYYNISSNGRADSASLDPSMQVNVWLMSQVALPIVQWITDKTTVVFPGKIYFNDTSLNTPTQWNWSFGDGTWYNTTNPDLGLNKSYQYTKRGVWIANLTVGNAAGTNTSASAAKSIRVIGYQGAELPETLTIWDQLNLFFRQLVDLIYCIFSGTVCGSNQAQVLEA